MYGTCGRIDNKADFDFDFDFDISKFYGTELIEMVIFSL